MTSQKSPAILDWDAYTSMIGPLPESVGGGGRRRLGRLEVRRSDFVSQFNTIETKLMIRDPKNASLKLLT